MEAAADRFYAASVSSCQEKLVWLWITREQTLPNDCNVRGSSPFYRLFVMSLFQAPLFRPSQLLHLSRWTPVQLPHAINYSRKNPLLISQEQGIQPARFQLRSSSDALLDLLLVNNKRAGPTPDDKKCKCSYIHCIQQFVRVTYW